MESETIQRFPKRQRLKRSYSFLSSWKCRPIVTTRNPFVHWLIRSIRLLPLLQIDTKFKVRSFLVMKLFQTTIGTNEPACSFELPLKNDWFEVDSIQIYALLNPLASIKSGLSYNNVQFLVSKPWPLVIELKCSKLDGNWFESVKFLSNSVQ